jgi:hypothetical protein
LEQQLEEYKGNQQEYVARMTELGAERDQSADENTKLDGRISNLNLQKNMVYHLLFFFLLLYLII